MEGPTSKSVHALHMYTYLFWSATTVVNNLKTVSNNLIHVTILKQKIQ